MIKKIVGLLVSATLLVSLAACGSSNKKIIQVKIQKMQNLI